MVVVDKLYSENVDEIAQECIKIYINPEYYINLRSSIVSRLFDLPDKKFSFEFKKMSLYGEVEYLNNIALMALISLYKSDPNQEQPSIEDILEHILEYNIQDLCKIMENQELKTTFINFFVKDLYKNFSENVFLKIFQLFRKLIDKFSYSSYKKDKKTIEFGLTLLKLLENWILEEKINIDNRWFEVRNLFIYSPEVIKKRFIELLMVLLKKSKYEVMDFFTYILKYVKNINLVSKFEQIIINSSGLPKLNLFCKAEKAYAKNDYKNALKYYEALPSDFPQIDSIRFNKLLYCAQEIADYRKIHKYLIKKIKIMIKYDIESDIKINTLINNLLLNSRIILIENGIQCKFCLSLISPNAIYCPICGEPQ